MRAGPGRALLVAVVLLAPAFASAARAQVAPCEASPKVKQALRNLPESTGDAQADQAATIAALKLLLKRYPNDVFVHSRYQDEATGETVQERDAVIAEYRGLAGKHPGDPIYTYLAARARIGVGTKELIPQLEGVTGRVPSARLALVRIYQSTNFKDLDKAREQLQAFMHACPTTLSAYQYITPRVFGSSEFVRNSAATLRKLLTSKTDVNSLQYYSTLWSVEFRLRPATEHDAVRAQVAADLKRLRAIDPGKSTSYYSTLREGYKLANDADGEKWASEQARRSGRPSYSAARDEFLKASPYPKPTDPPERRKTFANAYAAATAEWVKLAPNDVGAWFDRVSALREAEGVSPADVEAAGEGLLRAIAKNPHGMSFVSPNGGSSFALAVADLYARKGVRVDRLPDLVRQGIPELELLRIGLPSDLYALPEAVLASSLDAARFYGSATIVNIWIEVKDKDRARAALTRVQALADKSKPKDPKDPKYPTDQRTWRSRQVTYWKAMGDLAQLEGRKIDAITFYQNALLARAEPAPAGRPDELGDRARALWTETGGSNEAWQAWFTRRDLFGQPGAEAGGGGRLTSIEKTIPAFALTDLSGGKWTLADFKGKPTLVGIWATW